MLHMAIEWTGSADLVDALLRTRTYYVNRSFRHKRPLHFAIEAMEGGWADASVLRRLIEQPGIHLLGGHDTQYGTPLHHAASRSVEAVELLLDAGIDPNVTANVAIKEGSAPLMWVCPVHLAAYSGKAEIVTALAARGARIDEPCDRGFTPLMYLSMYSSRISEYDWRGNRTLTALVEARADVNRRRIHTNPSSQQTALYYALNYSCAKFCAQLIQKGAELSRMDLSTEQLIRHVVFTAHGASVGEKLQLLVQEGVDPMSAINPDADDQLHHEAAVRGLEDAVVALVSLGADAAARNSIGATALELLLWKADERGDWPWQGGIKAETVVALVKAGDFDSWEHIPVDFPGLERLFWPLYKKETGKLGELFKKLPLETREAIQEALRVLQRGLPGGVEYLRYKILARAFRRHRLTV